MMMIINFYSIDFCLQNDFSLVKLKLRLEILPILFFSTSQFSISHFKFSNLSRSPLNLFLTLSITLDSSFTTFLFELPMAVSIELTTILGDSTIPLAR